MLQKLLVRIVIVLGLWPGSGLAGDHDLTPREIYERDSSAVVMIIGYSNSGQRGSGGTGSIIQQDGLVLTNAHVVIEEPTGKPYPRLTVYMKPDRVSGDPKADLSRSGKGRVVAFSPSLDLALLKLDGLPGPFPVLELDDSDRIEIGDRVVAIGHPEQGGLWTLTTGTISAEFENFNATKGKSVFQTETGLNRGNSGGPLVNMDGEVIGINSQIATANGDYNGVGFALPSNEAANVYAQVVKSGRVDFRIEHCVAVRQTEIISRRMRGGAFVYRVMPHIPRAQCRIILTRSRRKSRYRR